ncbi:terpene synthase family protein [Kitasatospora sp. NPDC056783]|uniref:terpene synthase family protein n=1 Tax=Kitasatospora sp. NPDC056783 TaxID=3345943 RepID=UPI00369CD4E5
MARTVPYTAVHAERFARLAAEFERLSSRSVKPFRLREVFDHDGFAVEEYCHGFAPNPRVQEAVTTVRRFARRHGIWLAGLSDHVADMEAYLNPRASLDRLTVIAKAYTLDWYLDDTIGREKFAAMSDEERTRAARTRERILALCRTAGTDAGTDAGRAEDAVEEAMLLVLAELRDGSTREWYERFVRQWVEHVGMMCRDQNASASGLLPSVEEYTERRIVISGIPAAIGFGEFAAGRFLARRALVESGTEDLVDLLDLVTHRTGAVCCLSNDVFSFPRELRERCDANAVVVEALNRPRLTLAQAFAATMGRTRSLTAEFLAASAALETAAVRIGARERREEVEEFVRTVGDMLRATWVWQMHSARYAEMRDAFR